MCVFDYNYLLSNNYFPATEESFAALADEKSFDTAEGGLYEGVYKGQMVPEFENWCFDEVRKPGHYGMVKTTYGYHVMYFVESELGWIRYCRNGVQTEKSEARVVELREAAGIEINYKLIQIVNNKLI